jgi:hypothetical protein
MNDRDIKPGMVRAKTKDGREIVGWYCKVQGRHFIVVEQSILHGHYIILGADEVDISTATFESISEEGE